MVPVGEDLATTCSVLGKVEGDREDGGVAPRPVVIVLMRRVIEDPENDSPTAELLASTPFLTGGRVPVGGPIKRFLQRGYATFKFSSVDVPVL